ncbi:MAG: diguanylate cyclase [Desulfomonile tiedjei]|nr:diguanylate cyclase [Desulfomonile tiedjei]
MARQSTTSSTNSVQSSDIRRREFRAIAFLLVFGLVVWIVEAVLNYFATYESDLLGPLARQLQINTLFLPLVGIICFLGYGLYVSKIVFEIRKAEQELKESEERYRLLTHHSLTGIYIQQGAAFAYVNDRFADLLGYPASEIVGKDFCEFVHWNDRELVEERELARIQGQEVVPQYEFRLLCKDGAVRWVEVMAATITHQGQPACMGNVTEITERKRVETEREELISDLETTRETLNFQATHDALTGLLNRGAILENLNRELARSSREERHLTVVMIDLDHFKRVNDTCGHLIGDAVLQEVALRITSSVRSYDLVGRYGGEEIIVVLPGCDAASAPVISERIRVEVGTQPVHTQAGPIQVTVSLGVACIGPGSSIDLHSTVRHADKALYQAKDRGRNCVVITSVERGHSEDNGKGAKPEAASA